MREIFTHGIQIQGGQGFLNPWKGVWTSSELSQVGIPNDTANNGSRIIAKFSNWTLPDKVS